MEQKVLDYHNDEDHEDDNDDNEDDDGGNLDDENDDDEKVNLPMVGRQLERRILAAASSRNYLMA